jgi:hypothetical protein
VNSQYIRILETRLLDAQTVTVACNREESSNGNFWTWARVLLYERRGSEENGGTGDLSL